MTLTGGVDLKTEGITSTTNRPSRPSNGRWHNCRRCGDGTALGGGNVVRRASQQFSFDKGSQSYTVLPQHALTAGKDFSGIVIRPISPCGRTAIPAWNWSAIQPRNRAGGDFGQGWRLAIRTRSPRPRRYLQFRGVTIPHRMRLTNLFTGDREVLCSMRTAMGSPVMCRRK